MQLQGYLMVTRKRSRIIFRHFSKLMRYMMLALKATVFIIVALTAKKAGSAAKDEKRPVVPESKHQSLPAYMMGRHPEQRPPGRYRV